jgi:hypothetical protein
VRLLKALPTNGAIALGPWREGIGVNGPMPETTFHRLKRELIVAGYVQALAQKKGFYEMTETGRTATAKPLP